MKKIVVVILTLLITTGAFTQRVSAQDENTLLLNGNNQYMKILNHDDFNIALDESFTLTFWVKFDEFREIARAQRILSKRGSVEMPPKNGYEFFGALDADRMIAINAPGDDGRYGNSISAWTQPKGNSLNTWYHVGFVVDRESKKMYFYHDGTCVESTTNNSTWYVKNDYDVLVGAGRDVTNATIGYYMKGAIDNLRFWKKALSKEEIIADQTSDPIKDNLIAAYDFDAIQGTLVPDISGNGHNGVLVNYASEGPGKISAVSLIQDTNFAGRGNENEVILTAVVDVSGSEPANYESITLDMAGTTSINDVESIRIYSTGLNSKFDPRNPATGSLVGTCNPSEGEINCKLNGQVNPGENYLWICYQISDNAKEGNEVDASVLSVALTDQVYTLKNTVAVGSRTILLGRKLLYAPGDMNSKNYRIPAITLAHDGSLVTAIDKRKNNQGDLPEDIDVLIKRSADGGKTWSDALTIAKGTGYNAGYGDAALVRTNEEGGMLCLFVGGPGFFQSTPSSPIRTYVCKSTDNGISWSAPRDITNQLWGNNCSDIARSKWYGSFCSSGSALLTRSGRIMVVAAVRETGSTSVASIANYLYYSDDNGETWKVSSVAKADNGNEAKVVELNDGSILMSIRNQAKGARFFVKSEDGGLTWGAVSSWKEMVEPGCNGDIIRYTSTLDGYEKDRLLHSINDNPSLRNNVSVYVSYDEGNTWSVKKSICPTGSGYSSLTVLPDGTIGAFVEENYNSSDYSVYFLNFSLEWLTNGKDSYSLPTTDLPTLEKDGNKIISYRKEDGSIVICNAPVGSTVHIFNMNGQLISNGKIASSCETIPGQNMTSPVCLLTVTDGTSTFSKKIIGRY